MAQRGEHFAALAVLGAVAPSDLQDQGLLQHVRIAAVHGLQLAVGQEVVGCAPICEPRHEPPQRRARGALEDELRSDRLGRDGPAGRAWRRRAKPCCACSPEHAPAKAT